MWNFDEKLKNEPLYVRIYLQLKQMIMEGKYTEHQKMPSKRKLAQTLKVSPLTVDQAYQQLIAEGYVYSIEKSGFYVNKQIEILSPLSPQISHESEEIKHQRKYLYSFETNDIDTSLFPNTTWAKLSRKVLSENYEQMLNETDPQGLFLLRKEIARYLEIYRGMKVDIHQIVIGSGSTSLIGLIVEILKRNNHYAIENPGYKKIYQLFKANDVHLSLISLDEQGLNMDSLRESKASIVHITPSHQFPMGIVMPIQRRIELLNWASENPDRFIIEDDYDSEFRYQGMPIPALQGLDQYDAIIYMNTFTKTLAPSFRISYMVLPKRLMKRYQEISLYHGCTVPNFEQYILYEFMSEGYFERHVNRMRNLYKQKVEIIMKMIQKYPYIKLKGYGAGLHAILQIDKPIQIHALQHLLEDKKIKISSLNDYYHAKQDTSYPIFVLGYAGIPIFDLEHHIEQLLDVIDAST